MSCAQLIGNNSMKTDSAKKGIHEQFARQIIKKECASVQCRLKLGKKLKIINAIFE